MDVSTDASLHAPVSPVIGVSQRADGPRYALLERGCALCCRVPAAPLVAQLGSPQLVQRPPSHLRVPLRNAPSPWEDSAPS